MTNRRQFDRLRQTCSATLAEFITAAHETERQMQHLRLPVGVDQDRKILSQRRAEFDACHAYVVASHELAEFVHQHLELIQ
jgi:hypothetical protein